MHPGIPAGSPFDVPDLTLSGSLPPFVGGSPADPEGLLHYRQELARLGFATGFQWLDGSFMEDIETREKRHPGDVDLVTFCRRPDSALDAESWHALIARNTNLLRPGLVKAVYKCDACFVDLDTPPENVVHRTMSMHLT